VIRKVVLCLLLPLSALSVLGRAQTGLYPYGSFDTPGFDTIDRGSLNVHLSIPVVTKQGRGVPFRSTVRTVRSAIRWAMDSTSTAPTTSSGAMFSSGCATGRQRSIAAVERRSTAQPASGRDRRCNPSPIPCSTKGSRSVMGTASTGSPPVPSPAARCKTIPMPMIAMAIGCRKLRCREGILSIRR
jgi:hypothetical protein